MIGLNGGGKIRETGELMANEGGRSRISMILTNILRGALAWEAINLSGGRVS